MLCNGKIPSPEFELAHERKHYDALPVDLQAAFALDNAVDLEPWRGELEALFPKEAGAPQPDPSRREPCR